MSLTDILTSAKTPYGTPPFNGDFPQSGGAQPPTTGDNRQKKGLGYYLNSFFNPQNALGQFGQALIASSGGQIGDAMGYMMKANMLRQQQKPTRRVEHVGNQIGILDEMTGSFTPTYSAPKSPTGFEAELAAAGIDPESDEGRKMIRQKVDNQLDPFVTFSNDQGSYYGPRSGLSGVLGGGGTAPPEPPATAPTPAGGAPGGMAPRGLRNNNPLNLTISPWTRKQAGFSGTDDGGRYARFDSPENGLAAARALLGNYARRGFDTPREVIGRWAPSSENGPSTGNYTNFVAQRLGISPDAVIPNEKYGDLVAAMSDFENGKRGSVRVARSTPTIIRSDADYDALPSGTEFVGPDGKRRRKP